MLHDPAIARPRRFDGHPFTHRLQNRLVIRRALIRAVTPELRALFGNVPIRVSDLPALPGVSVHGDARLGCAPG